MPKRNKHGAISRRAAVKTLLAGVAGAPFINRGRYQVFAENAQEYSARAVRLVEETTVIDLLNQFRFPDFTERPPRIQQWLANPSTFTRADFEPYRASGIKVFALGNGPGSYEQAIQYCAQWNGLIASCGDWLTRIDDAGDFERVRAAGKVGIMLTFQNAEHFRTVADVDTFFGLGQRISQLTYNFANRLGSGFLEQRDGGLTVFGQSVIERMNRVGMAVDVSHCADTTTLDALAAARKPVLITHAACRALVPGRTRTKTDEMIQKMAKTGGVMGIAFLSMMIRDRQPVTIEHALDHFDYLARLVGVEYIGVGGDLDLVGNPQAVGGTAPPERPPNHDRYFRHEDEKGRITIRGLDHPKRMFDLTEGLIRRKYSDAQIKLMLGGNAARALGAIWTI